MPIYRKKWRRRTLRRKPATRKLAPKTALAVRKIVKAQMNKVIETKRNDYFNEPFPATTYYHNTWYTHDFNALYCDQGVRDEEDVTSNNRIGDSIYAKNLTIKLLITKYFDRPNVMIRILVLKVKSGLALGNPTIHNQVGNVIVNPVNMELPNLISVVYDQTFTSNNNVANQISGTRDTKFFWKKSFPINKRIKYPDSSTDPSHYTYRVYTALYDSQGSLTTDNVGRFSYFRSLYFQDA